MQTVVVPRRSRAAVPAVPAVRRRARHSTVAMVGAATSWGVGTAVTKLALRRTDMRPITLQAGELMASVVVLALIAVGRRRWPSASAWRHGRAGLLEPGASNVLALAGLSVTAATHASIIAALEPALVVAGSWLFLRRVMTGRTLGLMALTLVGATVVVTSGVAGPSGASPTGDGLVLAGVVCGAAYALVVARTVRQGHPLTLALVQQVWALVLVLPAAGATAVVGGVGPLPHATDVLLVALSGLLSYLVPFALYLAALQTMPAAEATQYLALIPVAGLMGAAVLLGEPLTGRALVGGAVMMVALGGLARTRAPRRPVSGAPANASG